MLGQQIRNIRLMKRMSQVELAKLLNVSKQSVSNWENDNIQPSIEMLVRLAEVFSVSTDYLLGLEHVERLDVDGLSPEIIIHIRQLIDDFRRMNNE